MDKTTAQFTTDQSIVESPVTYHSPPSPCGYLPTQTARPLIILPKTSLTPERLGRYLRQGFRRSGVVVYRPECEQCKACTSVRIPVANFCPNRSQIRTWRKYQHLKATILPLNYSDERFALYQRYQQMRHTDGVMDTDSADEFSYALLESSADSRMVEFRDAHDTLCMVVIMDLSDDGASAVYTFFDPNLKGLGIFAILWQINWLASLVGDYLYLGYWIGKVSNMRYKQYFKPLEMWRNQSWQHFSTDFADRKVLISS